MTRHEENRFMPFTADQMYDLIADIGRYPEFLPWCQAARFRREWDEDDIKYVEADLVIAFMAFREKFGSRVRMDRGAGEIDVEYIDGPLKKLANHWRFVEAEGGCHVEFMVEFAFKSRLLEAAIGRVFNEAMSRIVNAFEDRAVQLYGENPA